MAAARSTKDATGRMRYHGQGKRGQPGAVREAIGSLGLAIKSLTTARDHLTRVALESPDRMQRDALIADARSQVLSGINLSREVLSGKLPKGKAGKIAKTSANQMRLDELLIDARKGTDR